MTALEALKRINKFCIFSGKAMPLSLHDDIFKVGKALKALEIIKEKRVNVDIFLELVKKDADYKEYNRLYDLYIITMITEKLLTEQEFDLLKEILK